MAQKDLLWQLFKKPNEVELECDIGRERGRGGGGDSSE